MIDVQSEWINAPEAAKILTRNSGHPVSCGYVHRLIELGKLEAWKVHAHAMLVRKSSVEGYRVKQQPQRA